MASTSFLTLGAMRAKLCHHGDRRSLDDIAGSAIGRSATDRFLATGGLHKLPAADHELVAANHGPAQTDGGARIDGVNAARNGFLAGADAAHVVGDRVICARQNHDDARSVVANHG